MAEIRSVKLNPTKAAARAKREEQTANATAEQLAKSIIRKRAFQRATQLKRAHLL